MKINYPQLETHLSKKISRLYILSGDELFLKQDALGQIRKAVKNNGFTERQRFLPEANSDWENLYQLLHANSLLAEKRLLELDCRHSLPNKTAASILEAYAKCTFENNILLIDIGKVDAKIAKCAWYQACEQQGVLITIWPLSREQLAQWIITRAAKYKMNLTRSLAELIADYTEGHIAAAAQALEKIYLLKTTDITPKLIQQVLTDESRFNVFDFIENLLRGDQQRVLHILQNLQAEGTEPILILWAITRELRSLAEMAELVKQGMGLENLYKKYRIFYGKQTAVKQFLQKYSAQDCWRHLLYAEEIDKMIKGEHRGNVWETLQLFCLRCSVSV